MTLHPLLRDAEGVLSDLDGTLIDSSGPVERAWEGFARRHGLDPQTVISFAQGRPAGETVRLLAPDADGESESALQERAEVEDTAGIIALPGAAELLAGQLRGGGLPVAIVTSCSTALAHARLAAAGLPVPDVLVTYDDVGRGKPDPECFLLAARRLGVNPARCVVLEDAPAGITAGRLAGATVIAVRSTHSDDALAEADAIVDGMGDLLG
jgi:sugar-phosphatase